MSERPPEGNPVAGPPAASAAEPLVFAVVLNYRCAHQTIACVRALGRSDYSRLKVLVVDNCSADGSVAELTEALPAVELLCNRRNLGYGDGNNLGIRHALAAGAELIWVLTPDVRVEPDSLTRLVKLMQQDRRIGVCGPIVHLGNRCIVGSRLVERLGYLPRHEYRHESQSAGLPQAAATDYVDGCAIMLRRAAVEQVGLLRDDFFLYFDEAEYCLRARRRGWKVVLCGRAHVHTRAMEEDRNDRAFYMIRNSLMLARAEGRHVLTTLLRHVVSALLHVCGLSRRNTPHFAAVTWRGVKSGLFDALGVVPKNDRTVSRSPP